MSQTFINSKNAVRTEINKDNIQYINTIFSQRTTIVENIQKAYIKTTNNNAYLIGPLTSRK